MAEVIKQRRENYIAAYLSWTDDIQLQKIPNFGNEHKKEGGFEGGRIH